MSEIPADLEYADPKGEMLQERIAAEYAESDDEWDDLPKY